MPNARKPGPLDLDPQTVLRDSVRLLFASGLTANAVAKALKGTRSDVDMVLDPIIAAARQDILDLALRIKPKLGSAELEPERIANRLKLIGVRSAISPHYRHGIMAGHHDAAAGGSYPMIELRRFSTAPGKPTEWVCLAGWSFLERADRERAIKTWILARGLPTSIDKRHWGGPNRPVKAIRFLALD